MSGVTLINQASRSGASAEDRTPSRPFGQRQPAADGFALGNAHNMDRDVPDLRRRIVDHAEAGQGPLPWAVGGLVLLGLALTPMGPAVAVASALARGVSALF